MLKFFGFLCGLSVVCGFVQNFPLLPSSCTNFLTHSHSSKCLLKAHRPLRVGGLRKAVCFSNFDNDIVEGPFLGRFGTWFVNSKDAQEVLVYRLSLLGSALALLLALGFSFMPSSLSIDSAIDACILAFLAFFGSSLATIHIYMKPMHNMLKVLWSAGVFGSLVTFAVSPSHHLALETYLHPEFLLASGWVFVALTGLFFKEFACFQRFEASLLFALVPVLTGGHFLHLLPFLAEQVLSLVFASGFLFFAIRKFDQPYQADIGDKTIFEKMAEIENPSDNII